MEPDTYKDHAVQQGFGGHRGRERAKAQFVRDLGAADVIDYAHEDFADGSRTFDVGLDIGGVRLVG